MAEKILASRSGKSVVRPGEYVWANVDGTGVFEPIPPMDKLDVVELHGDGEEFDEPGDRLGPLSAG